MGGAGLDRRIIYLMLAAALSVPLWRGYSVPPARMRAAEALFEVIEGLNVRHPQIAVVALDLGPSTKAENEPQAEAVIEHLMRKRVPFAVLSMYYQAEPFLKSIPERVARRLAQDNPGQRWEYGRDWVNLGYRVGAGALLQALPKSRNLAELFAEDARGGKLSDLPIFKDVRTLDQIALLAQFTGLAGMLDGYLQFFQKEDYRPIFVHGCTSITIPESFIYLDSGQLQGLLEGIAGAAWYSELLQRRYGRKPKDYAAAMNTSLGIANLAILLLIAGGNLAVLIRRRGGAADAR